MASSLLDRALGGVQGQRGGAGNGGGSRRQSGGGGGGGRGSPYEVRSLLFSPTSSSFALPPAGEGMAADPPPRPLAHLDATRNEQRPADSWKHDKFASQDDDSSAPPKAAPAGKGSLAARLGAASPAGGAGAGARSNKLVIKNLHYEVSERELELLFVQIGPIIAGPKIKFDRSGRSEGIAWVSYGSEEHAAQAKEAFNGAPAKGQPIEVEYDTRPDRASAAGAPAGGAAAPGSLLARLGGGNDAPRSKYTPPTSRPSRGGARNERGVGSQGASSRGGRGAARGGRGGGREKKEPKTNEDLDRELEAFMKQPEGAGTKPAAGAPPALAAPVAAAAAPAEATSGGDVEMS